MSLLEWLGYQPPSIQAAAIIGLMLIALGALFFGGVAMMTLTRALGWSPRRGNGADDGAGHDVEAMPNEPHDPWQAGEAPTGAADSEPDNDDGRGPPGPPPSRRLH